MKYFLLLSIICVGLIKLTAQPFSQTIIGSNIVDPSNITRIDLDKDGDEDILCLDSSTDIVFLSNNGDGTYLKTSIYSGLVGAAHFEVADMDNDQELDIVASDMMNELFVFLKNDGSENFTANIITNDADDLNNPAHFAIANFNGDNYKDIVVCAQHGNMGVYGVFYLENNGDGTFANPDEITDDDFVNHVVAGDIDGDTDMDIIVSRNGMFSNGGLYKGINNGSGSFTYTAINASVKFDHVQLVNMDGDSDIDLVAMTNVGDLFWYENDGSSAFTAHEIAHPYKEDMNDRIVVYPTNVDGDADMDLFFFSKINGDTNMDEFDVGYLENDGSQNFSVQLFFQDLPELISAAPLDLDADGDVDFYLGSEDNSDIIFYKNLKVDTPTDVKNEEALVIQVYPNPASDQLNIESSELISQIEISDLSGRIILQQEAGNKKVTIDISSLKVGVYNVVVKNSNHSFVKKVVKR